jgi:tRNA pseudouridine32 synthase/23S rRNA pseudouridine746 synthase
VSGATDHAEVHVVIESPDDSAVDVLHEATGLSKQRIKLAMSQGAVWVTRGRNTRRLRRVKRALSVGDEVHLYYDAGILL